MIICPKCKGKAECYKEVFNDGKRRREILVECDMCHGSGKVPMTNEEWFNGLSTKKKAEWLENKMMFAAKEQGTFTAKGWEMWLKAPHEGN